jgi:hypothetical protein
MLPSTSLHHTVSGNCTKMAFRQADVCALLCWLFVFTKSLTGIYDVSRLPQYRRDHPHVRLRFCVSRKYVPAYNILIVQHIHIKSPIQASHVCRRVLPVDSRYINPDFLASTSLHQHTISGHYTKIEDLLSSWLCAFLLSLRFYQNTNHIPG